MAIEKVNQSGLHGPVKLSIRLAIPKMSGIYIKRFVIVNRYIFQVVPLRYLHKEL